MTDRKYKADAKNYTAPKRTHTAAAPEVITRHFDSITQAHTKYTRTQVYLFPIIFLRFGFFFLYKPNIYLFIYIQAGYARLCSYFGVVARRLSSIMHAVLWIDSPWLRLFICCIYVHAKKNIHVVYLYIYKKQKLSRL